jgi:hypothetical protein
MTITPPPPLLSSTTAAGTAGTKQQKVITPATVSNPGFTSTAAVYVATSHTTSYVSARP